MTKGASGSSEAKRPASLSGWVIETHIQPPDRSTRAASATAPGMSSMSIRELYATTRSNELFANGREDAFPRT